MKLHLATTTANVITALGDGWVRVGQVEYRGNLVLTADTVAEGWAPAGFEALAESDYAGLLATRPDVVLLGTGQALRFPHPRLTRALTAAQVGVEVMDTAAACRTFNVLAAEGRRVTAALIL
jgi:uncharacterized protein